MKALMKERPAPGLTLVDIPRPSVLNPDDVLFKVEYCAICVGEIKVYDWNEWAAPTRRYRSRPCWVTRRLAW